MSGVGFSGAQLDRRRDVKIYIVLAFVAFGLFGCTHSNTTKVLTPDGDRVVIDEGGFGSTTRSDTTDTKEAFDKCMEANLNVTPYRDQLCRQRAAVPLNGAMQGGSMMMQQGYGLGLVPMAMPNVGGPVTIMGSQTMSPQQSAWASTNGTVGLVEMSPSGGASSSSASSPRVQDLAKVVARHDRFLAPLMAAKKK